MTRIVVFGSINVDLVVQLPRLPSPGETLSGDRFRTFPGGKGANQAVAASRLGGKVVMIGRVGHDGFGDLARTNLVANGVDLSGVERDPSEPTGRALIMVDRQGQNIIALAGGANGAVGKDEVGRLAAHLGRGDVLVMQLEVAAAAVTAAAVKAHGLGAQVLLNAAPATPIDDATLAAVDWLAVNEHEALLLSPGAPDPMQAANRLFGRGVKQVVVTLGASGAFVVDARGGRAIEAFAVEAVDATGAGDAFVGALAVALAAGAPTDAAVRFGNAAGAAAATALGAQTALPRSEDLRRLFGIDLDSLVEEAT